MSPPPPRRPDEAPTLTLVGESEQMLQIRWLIKRMGPQAFPTLITGETGTGKELAAQALHEASGRRPLVPINCAAFPEHLLESELFGHERGSFTGADRSKPGLLEIADRGTLFLDEIGELPLSLQPKLLRVIETHEFRRVGGTKVLRVNVRIISATNRDLDMEVAEGGFRQDLLERLRQVWIHMPALRERPEDIPLLAAHFLRHAASGAGAKLLAEALRCLQAYPWPSNVRELKNVVEVGAVLAEGGEIRREHLPEPVRKGLAVQRSGKGTRSSWDRTLAEVQREHILRVWGKTNGNKTLTASILGIDRKTLSRKLEEYGENGGG